MKRWYNNPSNVDDWYEKYSLLKEYYNIYGCIPKTSDVFLNYGIGQWVYRQRKRNNDGELPQVFINLMNDIDTNWA